MVRASTSETPMFAVYAISPKGTEMVASVHATETEADAERATQAERRGDLWWFVVRKVKLADENDA